MRFAEILCLAAGVAGYTYQPNLVVKQDETQHIPTGDCETFAGCHECVLAGCSPVTSAGKHFEHCAVPGEDDGKGRPQLRPTYEQLFTRASKCYDEKKLCSLEETDGKKGTKDLVMGWKTNEKKEPIPDNYFCHSSFESKQYSSMSVLNQTGTQNSGVAAFFKLEYSLKSTMDKTTVYSNWSEFRSKKSDQDERLMNANKKGEYYVYLETHTKNDKIYVGNGDQSTSQQVIYWPKKSNQKLENVDYFKVEFTGIDKQEFDANTKWPFDWIAWVIVVPCIIICGCGVLYMKVAEVGLFAKQRMEEEKNHEVPLMNQNVDGNENDGQNPDRL